jgi:hypothetical protein
MNGDDNGDYREPPIVPAILLGLACWAVVLAASIGLLHICGD